MKHPILYHKKNLYLYGIIWLLFSAAYFLLFSILSDESIRSAYIFIEAFVYSIVFAVLSLWIWYVIRYNVFSDAPKTQYWLWPQIVSAAIIIGLWLLISSLFTHIFCYIIGIEIPDLKYSNFVRFVVGIVLYAINAMLYYLVYFLQDLQEKKLHEEQLQYLLKETELKHLISQLNPHFLFNSLNSIHSLIMINTDKAGDMLVKLSEYFRYSLRSSNVQEKSLAEELENCRRYLDIEKIRFGDRLATKDEIEEATLQHHVPTMLLQPLYENVIKHAVHECKDKVTVHTKAYLGEEYLHIIISNNYDKDAVSPKGEKIGLRNLQQRLSRLYANQDLLVLDKTDNQFTVKIDIPLPEQKTTGEKNND